MLQMFSPPANLDDLDANGKAAWSTAIARWLADAKASLPPGGRLFSLLEEDPVGAASALIPWNAFPRKFALRWPSDLDTRWQTAEQVVTRDMMGRSAAYFVQNSAGQFVPANLPFRDQDEYCEWRAVTDPATGRLKKVVFTCENPEYWNHLADTQPSRVLELYRELIDPAIAEQDILFQTDVYVPKRVADGSVVADNRRGFYNPLNRWNTTDGIMHLTHPANSLQAEVALAADATILRTDASGTVITDDTQLICCAGYGEPNRSSDPAIGGRVNELVRGGFAVTINDPVGLYLGSIDLQPIEPPGGIDAADCWRVVRGSMADQMILRAEFALPEGSGFELDETLVGGEPLRYGSQLADLITVVIHGLGVPRTDSAPTDGCLGKCCQVPEVPLLLSIVDLNEVCPPVLPASPPDSGPPIVLSSPNYRDRPYSSSDLPVRNRRI